MPSLLPPSFQPPRDLSGLFAGLSVSGQATPTSTPTVVVKPTHSLNKKTSPRVVKRERNLKKVKNEENSTYGDILGVTSSTVTPSPSTVMAVVSLDTVVMAYEDVIFTVAVKS